MTDTATARFNMIEQQIRTWEVLDPQVLSTLSHSPREDYVPAAYRGLAFADIEIPLADGQQMLSPKIEGRFLQALQLQATDKVLLIGVGSGYLAALIAQHAKQVTAIEISATLYAQAAQNLQQHQVTNVRLLQGDGHAGLDTDAPYDAIVFSASSSVEPEGVRFQLSVGGRMLIVLGQAPVMQATLIQRLGENSFKQDVLFETCLPAMHNAPQAPAFRF